MTGFKYIMYILSSVWHKLKNNINTQNLANNIPVITTKLITSHTASTFQQAQPEGLLIDQHQLTYLITFSAYNEIHTERSYVSRLHIHLPNWENSLNRKSTFFVNAVNRQIKIWQMQQLKTCKKNNLHKIKIIQ